MAKKKTYYIPTIEIVQLECNMPITLANSKESVPGGKPSPRHRWTDVF